MDAKFLFQPAIGHLPDTNRPTEITAEKSHFLIYLKNQLQIKTF